MEAQRGCVWSQLFFMVCLCLLCRACLEQETIVVFDPEVRMSMTACGGSLQLAISLAHTLSHTPLACTPDSRKPCCDSVRASLAPHHMLVELLRSLTH